ncbi:hypothetical protein EBT31_17325 [bacterium]|jgi:predicted RNA-binding Zn-ribbon protein involved in translation (DUF1610 family)|nr:hypothetical protein [bacterium]
MTTLEARYETRIAEFAAAVKEAEEALASCLSETHEYAAAAKRLEKLREEEVGYILQSAPFIKEYTGSSPAVAALPTTCLGKTGLDKFITVTSKSNKNQVFQKYLLFVENEITDAPLLEMEIDKEFTCPACEVGMLELARESAMVCPQCGVHQPYVGSTGANLSYQEEISLNVPSSFSYKRLNHFNEWLNSIQGKGSTENITDEVINAIKAEFKKSRASTRKEITHTKVREYMKKLNMNKLYEHAHYVTMLINGVPPAKIDPETETTLRNMFVAIQGPFDRAVKDMKRVNFLSYSYTLYKFCELLGRDDLLSNFNLLKSPEKLYQQDVIWKKMCAELGWEFIRSV